jgi:hypothetical protein
MSVSVHGELNIEHTPPFARATALDSFFLRLFQVLQEEENCLRVFGGTLVVARGVLCVARGLGEPL